MGINFFGAGATQAGLRTTGLKAFMGDGAFGMKQQFRGFASNCKRERLRALGRKHVNNSNLACKVLFGISTASTTWQVCAGNCLRGCANWKSVKATS